MPVKLKGRVYQTVVRPCSSVVRDVGLEARLEVNEMRMLRWMCIVTTDKDGLVVSWLSEIIVTGRIKAPNLAQSFLRT